MQIHVVMMHLETMLDLLDHGRDGEPRSIAMEAADADAAAALVRVITQEADRRGYVPIAAERFLALTATELPEHLLHRTFALLHTHSAGERTGTGALVAATIVNPRPHVLVTIAVRGDARSKGFVAREARSVYAAEPFAIARPAMSPESEKYLARAARGQELARLGRHEPGVRVMREAFAALVRRRDPASAVTAGIILGRVLLERGQVDAADRAFSDAAAAVERADRESAAVAHVWMALARTDGGRLTDAESLLRATRLATRWSQPATGRWADAVLARCLLWQDRIAEAAHLISADAAMAAGADPLVAVCTLTTQSRVLLASGRVFEAGQHARAALEWSERSGDLLLQHAARLAQLRVLAGVGDLALLAERASAALAIARTLHAPLRGVRVRLLRATAFHRAGHQREAEAELRRAERLSAAAPALLQRHVESTAKTLRGPRALNVSAPAAAHACVALDLLRSAQDEETDRVAAQKVITRLLAEVRAARLDVQSAAGGALASLVTVGSGVSPRLGTRALEAGIVIGPECREGVWELATPVRTGSRLLGALACRWPPGREAPAGVTELVALAAAVVAPRLDGLLAARAEEARAATTVPELIGASAALADVRRSIARAAAAPFSVIVEGESGTGKELVARAIHHLSARRDRRFCDINCAAIPDDLIESELFGHAKGAFTGALVERAGLFEEANGGTLFLDELPDLSLRAQAKLLRVIQQGELRRVGEGFSRSVDVRLVTATNRAMHEEVAHGRFRQDLLYRLDVIRIRLPPLRDRPEDVPALARHFWGPAAERAGTRATLSHAVLAELARYHWPGNVRELQNVIAALAVGAPSRGLVRSTLLPAAITGAMAVTAARLDEARRQFERRFVEVALARAGGSRTRAAAQLGLSRQGLLKLMARLGLLARVVEM